MHEQINTAEGQKSHIYTTIEILTSKESNSEESLRADKFEDLHSTLDQNIRKFLVAETIESRIKV